MYKLKTFFFALFLILLFSCAQENKEINNNLFKHVVKTEKGTIRGVIINDEIKQVKKLEKEKFLIEETSTFLEYEYPLEEESFVVIAYLFDEKGCSEINVDTYFDSEEKAKEMITVYQKQFTQKYGEPKKEDSLLLWNDVDKTITVEVDIFNKADGEVMLTIFANE